MKSQTKPPKEAVALPKPDGRRERGRLRQLAMIKAASELFISEGYKGTTLDAIIAKSGGSREAIYSTFGGKHGLVGAIIAQANERLSASIVASTRLDMPPSKALQAVALQLVHIWRSAEGMAINSAVLTHGLEAPELIDAWYLSGTKRSIESISAYLEAQVAKGRLVALDAPLVARQFVTLLIGEIAFPTISRSAKTQSVNVQVMRCVNLIVRAYATAE